MTESEIRQILTDALVNLFEIEPERIAPDTNLYEDLEIDSIDAIDLIDHIKRETGRMIVMQPLPRAYQIKFIAGGRRQLVCVVDTFTIEEDTDQLMTLLQNGLGKLPGAAGLLRTVGWPRYRNGKTHYLSSPWKSPLLN